MRCGLLSGNDINEEVKHIRLRQRGGDVGPLERTAFVIFCVDPRAHGELGDEDVAALGEEDGRFRGYHFHLWVGFHDLFYACEG